MPTTISHHQKEHSAARYYRTSVRKKNYTQTVSIAMGCLLMVIGLAGILNPEFMGLHLSAMHTLVLVASGCLSIWGATHHDARKAYYVDLVLGIFFALNAIAGFALGSLGTPGVGYDAPDALLLRIAPGFIELGLVDHCVHAFLSLFYFTGAFSWKRRHHAGDHSRKVVKNN